MSEGKEERKNGPTGGRETNPAVSAGGGEWSSEWSPPGGRVWIKEGSSGAKSAAEAGSSAGPDRALRSGEGPDLSIDNLERARELGTEGRSIFSKVFESARYRKDRFSIWWNNHLVGVYENKMSELVRSGDKQERKAAGAEAQEAAIQKQLESSLAAIQKAGIEPDAELGKKVESEKEFHRREREEAKVKAGEFRERAEEMKAKMAGYVEKRDKTVDAITGKWQEAIDGNNRQKSGETTKLGEVKSCLERNLDEQKRLMAMIAELKKLPDGPSKVINADIKRALKVKEEELAAKKEEQGHYVNSKKEIEGSIAEIDKRNKKLQAKSDKLRGKKGKVSVSAASGKTQAAGSDAAAAAAAGGGGSPESGGEKLRPFSDFVNIWNEKSTMKVDSFGVTALEDVMDKESALGRIRGRLLFRYRTETQSRMVEDEIKKVGKLF